MNVHMSSTTDNSLDEALSSIGLSQTETIIVQNVFASTKGLRVRDLARMTKLPRTTIYDQLTSLTLKGYIRKGLDGDSAVFYPEDMVSVVKVIEEKEKELLQAKKTILKDLGTRRRSFHRAKFSIYEKEGMFSKIFSDIVQSGEKESLWFWPVSEMVNVVDPETFNFFTERRLRDEIHLRTLWPHKRKVDLKLHPYLGEDNAAKTLRKIRMMPKGVDFKTGIGVYGSKVACVSSEKENYGFVIESQELADAIRGLFEYFWKVSDKKVLD